MIQPIIKWFSAYRDHDDMAEYELRKKNCEVEKRILSLTTRYQNMDPAKIIEELNGVHKYHELPDYFFAGNVHSAAYPIFLFVVRHPALSESDAEELARVLLWPELKKHTGDNKCRMAIVEACIRFPTNFIQRTLREHMYFVKDLLEKERKEYIRRSALTTHIKSKGTKKYSDLCSEVNLLEEIITL